MNTYPPEMYGEILKFFSYNPYRDDKYSIVEIDTDEFASERELNNTHQI
tara:strand:+ start:357 stop:503 length:147 start_codon:yes stop_codon:yes gene_type:complete